jgi:hypothetical protein
MSEVRNSGVAADTKVETPEGSMTIRICAGKAIPVLTRNEENAILFRMMLDVRKIAEGHPVLKVTLENGSAFRVAPEQVLYLADRRTLPASRVQVGAALLPAFHYPAGYQYRTDAGAELVSDQTLRVAKVEPAGTAEIYALSVHETGCFFLAAGVLCQADPAAE